MVNMKTLILMAGVIALILAGFMFVANPNKSNNPSNDTAYSSDQNTELKWYTDLNSAISEAQKTNKPIFALFSASWCPACQQLESETLTNSQVQQKLAQNYVAVKIDTDTNPELSSQYGVYGLPTIIIMDSNGGEVKKIIGYQSSDQLLSLI